MTTAPQAAATQAAPPVAATPPAPAAPNPVDEALGRARAAAQAKRWNEAIGICQDILLQSPEHPHALAVLGTVYAQQGRVEPGIEHLERAVAKEPNVPGWHANLCALYRLASRCDEAVRSGQIAVRMQPNSPQYLLNLALALTDIDERQQATACLLRAIGQDPKEAQSHLALGQLLLAKGEMQPGWIEYEWRNEIEAAKGTLPRITSAMWNGMYLDGRLLVVGDQGYGDTIQFARYIPLASRMCKELILGCSPELVPILSPIPGITSIHHRWDEIPPHAAHQRLSSLPYLFRTEIETIPSPEPYIFADTGRVAQWRTRLDSILGPGLRIGIAWSGRPTHPNDRRRSTRLATLRPLIMPGVQFVALQKPIPEIDLPDVPAFPGLTDLSAEMKDFGDTAALIASLDLQITVDTSVVHLAGAMGRPAWALLAKPNDWRWMLERPDSPWYPSLRLFRQAKAGAWELPVSQAAEALRTLVAAGVERRIPVPA